MEWYVLNYDFNNKKLVHFNIFNSVRFSNYLELDLMKYKNGECSFDQFKDYIELDLKSAFWSKREYELSIGDAFDTNLDNYEKIDVYTQVIPNLNILVEYILKQNNLQK